MAESDLLKALSILSGSAVKLADSQVAKSVSMAELEAGIQKQELLNEQYHHKSGLNQSTNHLNKILTRQEGELKDLENYFEEHELSSRKFYGIDEMNSSLEGNALWEEHGEDLYNDQMVWGEVTTNAIEGIENLGNAREINEERIRILTKLKNDHLRGASESANVGYDLENKAYRDQADFDAFAEAHKEMDGEIDTMFEFGFRSKRPSDKDQAAINASVASKLVSELNFSNAEKQATILQNKIDNIPNDELQKEIQVLRGLAETYRVGKDQVGYIHTMKEIYTKTGLNPDDFVFNEIDFYNRTVDKNAIPPFEGAFDKQHINKLNNLVNNLKPDDTLNTSNVFKKVEGDASSYEHDYAKNRIFQLENLDPAKLQTPEDVWNLENTVLDQILHDLDYASEGNLDFFSGVINTENNTLKGRTVKTVDDFESYTEKRDYLAIVLPKLVSSEFGGAASSFSEFGLANDAETAKHLDFYGGVTGSLSADENTTEVGYGTEHRMLMKHIQLFNALIDFRTGDNALLFKDIQSNDYQNIIAGLETYDNMGDDSGGNQLPGSSGLTKEQLTNIQNSKTLEELMGFITDNPDIERQMNIAWATLSADVNWIETLESKTDLPLVWEGSDNQKNYLLGVLKMDFTLDNLTDEDSNQVLEVLDALSPTDNQNSDSSEATITEPDPSLILSNQSTINQSQNNDPMKEQIANTDIEDLMAWISTDGGGNLNEDSNLIAKLNKEFEGDETTLNEINNFASSISTKVVNNDIKRLKSLDTSIPISDAHIQDTLRIMNDTNLSIDDAEYLLSTYYDMPEQYRENVSLTTYHSVYGGKN